MDNKSQKAVEHLLSLLKVLLPEESDLFQTKHFSDRFLDQWKTGYKLVPYCKRCMRIFKNEERYCPVCFNTFDDKMWKWKGGENSQGQSVPYFFFICFDVTATLKQMLQGT